jgi:orotidine 5'-phosphate decarboxylase subfamily 1
MELSFLKRASLTRHPLAQKLLKMIEDKRTNLAVAIDVTSQIEFFRMADELGPYISVLKTHVDILDDYTPDFGEKLRLIAEKHHFLIFEDRKFADIGQTVSLQYSRGIYRIAEWADIVNAHIVPGPGIIEGLKSVARQGSGLLLLAEMSSAGTLAKGSYAKKAVEFAEAHSDYVFGFICLKKLSSNPGMVHFTPGVKLQKGKDSLGQRYRTVDEILAKNLSDVIIVGRDITHASNPKAQAALYQASAWSIYEKTRS